LFDCAEFFEKSFLSFFHEPDWGDRKNNKDNCRNQDHDKTAKNIQGEINQRCPDGQGNSFCLAREKKQEQANPPEHKEDYPQEHKNRTVPFDFFLDLPYRFLFNHPEPPFS